MKQEQDEHKLKSTESVSVGGRGFVVGFLILLAVTIALIIIIRFLL